MVTIRKATPADAAAVAALGDLLWPGHPAGELEAEFSRLLVQPEAAVFLASLDGQSVGFAQCQLRHDYVEGTETTPVGYLEGIYTVQSVRRKGIAGKLLAACEAWARSLGCREFASDCELENTGSLDFHLSLGFSEAGRIICFTKPL